MSAKGIVYVIQFSEPITGHAHFYVGSTPAGRLSERFHEHATGQGARLTQVAVERGIGMQIVHTVTTKTVSEARKLERHIKNQKGTGKWLARQRGARS